MPLKIYTKTGDNGNTSLLGGEKVAKSDLQIEAYGNVDELNTFVGLLRDQSGINSQTKTQLIWIQENLFSLGSILACTTDFKGMNLPEISKIQIGQLETWIDKYEEDLPELTSFILPGGHPTVSTCHVCRTVCRRTERSIVKWSLHKEIDKNITSFINRLSDYFFILARKISKDLNLVETPWIGNKE
jgi:cob(I)alamin adenosyltransferase|tara:strand:- start:496 stop:1056 length:561 start_codon:yes stop_codon:yes gene_type:complete